MEWSGKLDLGFIEGSLCHGVLCCVVGSREYGFILGYGVVDGKGGWGR